MPHGFPLDPAIKLGVKHLDEKLGFDWPSEITEIVDMASPKRDILGQLFGSYTKGLDELRIWCSGSAYGFTPRSAGKNSEHWRELCEELGSKWEWTLDRLCKDRRLNRLKRKPRIVTICDEEDNES